MEYKIDASGEKLLIKKIGLISIVVIIIGLILYFFNNPQYIYKSKMRALNNKIIDSFCEEIDELKQYDQNLNSNIEIKYNDNQDLKIYTNKNVDNKYNILTVNENLKICESEGYIYVEIPEIAKCAQINKGKLPIDINEGVLSKINTKDFKKVYKEFTGAFINELNADDFYKTKYTYLNKKGKERTAYEYVLKINEVRVKEITLNVLNKMMEKEAILLKVDGLINKFDEDGKTSKEIIEETIKLVSEYEANEDINFEITLRNGNIINSQATTLKILWLDKTTIIAETNATIEKNKASIQSINNVHNNEYDIQISEDSNNELISINFTDSDKQSHNFSYSIVKYGDIEKGTIDIDSTDFKFKSNYEIENVKKQDKLLSIFDKEKIIDNDSEIKGDIYFNIDDKEYKYDIKSKIVFEPKKEEIELKPVVAINNFTDEELQMIGNYFEISFEELRQIFGVRDIEATPQSPNIIENPEEVIDPGSVQEPTKPTSDKPSNLARW